MESEYSSLACGGAKGESIDSLEEEKELHRLIVSCLELELRECKRISELEGRSLAPFLDELAAVIDCFR